VNGNAAERVRGVQTMRRKPVLLGSRENSILRKFCQRGPVDRLDGAVGSNRFGQPLESICGNLLGVTDQLSYRPESDRSLKLLHPE
jgi:hypothetical protein